MLPHAFRPLLVCLALILSLAISQAGLTQYVDRGKTDFDTALLVLNPYGTWSKIDGLWAYTPTDHQAPYTEGRWIYTEYGWYWKGRLPHSWVTEHYGYWKRSADKVWSWYPGPYWLPQIVELRATSTHIGWRSAAVNQDGNFIEKGEQRWAKTDEWTFVTLVQFAGPITPASAAKPEVAQGLLEDSTECRHTYLTYREIDRPGPHPADFLGLGDGAMFAPKTLLDLAQPPPSPVPTFPAPPKTTRPMTGTNAPSLMGGETDPAADKRQVKYWLTMSLPTYWTPPPVDGKPDEIYLYRPDFYQDEDGIARRITLWFNPKSRATLKEVFGDNLNGKPDTSSPKAGQGTTPAVPAETSPSRDPFRSPFDDTYHGSSGSAARPGSSSKNPPVPAGTNTDKAPIPLPLINATNAAPADRK